MYDILIKNGTVIDGTGGAMVQKDIAIQDDKIVAIDDLSHEVAHEIIDAKGKYIIPGIIDVNNHSDAYWNIFNNPTLDSLLRQGVTTIVGGNSGASLAPLGTPDAIKSIQKWTDVSRLNINWRTMREFLRTVESRKLNINFATLVGHSTLRRAFICDEHRELSDDEIAAMTRMLDDAMNQGALGLSTAIHYTHARTTTRDELIQLAQVVYSHDGVYTVYLADEADGMVEALGDAIDVARETGVRLHISHLKAVGQDNWPLMNKALMLISAAHDEGIRVSADLYPYTVMSAVLYTLLPDWVTDGGRTMMLARLRDTQTRAKVVAEFTDHDHVLFSSAILSVSPLTKNTTRRHIGQLAKMHEQSVEEMVIDVLLASEGHAIVLLHALCEEAVQAALKNKHTIIASNGGGYSQDDWRTGQMIHQRSFGAFARLFETYVEQQDLLSWEDAVMKVTKMPADQFGIAGRGLIAPEMYADIVILDPHAVAERATIDQPYRYAKGIETVIIGGAIAFSDDTIRTAKGQILRHKK